MAYATNTSVSATQTRTDLEKLLTRYGATRFGYTTGPDTAAVAFERNGVTIRFNLPFPERESREFTRTPTGQLRSKVAAQTAYDQAVRSRWRSLLLVVKAKLEAVDSGISIFEEEFYPQIVLPTGRTVYEETHEYVSHAIETGDVGPLRLSITS